MTFRAPVETLKFSLSAVADIEAVAATGAFSDYADDVKNAILEEAAKLADNVLAPLNRIGDLEHSKLVGEDVKTPEGFREAYQAFVEGGWQGLQFPAEAGGMGLPKVLGLAVNEMLYSANMAFGLCPMLTYGAIEALLAHGTDEQRAMYLPRLLSGEWSATMNLTEPSAGSDVGALKSKAVPNGDGSWAVSGQKIFITWGEHDCAENIIHLVLARTPDGEEGVKGISLFLVPKILDDGSRNSLRAIGVEEKMGINASPTCTMEYDGAKGWLIGEEFGGMRCMFTMMNAARLNVGVQGVAIAERAYQAALAYAEDRVQGRAIGATGKGPHTIIHHPDVRRMLALMRAKIEAARGICLSCGAAADLAEHAGDDAVRARAKRREELLTPLAKSWSTDVGVEVASLAVQVHGGMGFIEETGVAQHYRDARIAPIYEGTNGIQAMDLIGRKLSMANGLAYDELFEDIAAVITSCEEKGGRGLSDFTVRMKIAYGAVRDLTDWMKGATPEDRLAGATPFLTMMSELVGGMVLAKGALAAPGSEREGLARFYGESVLAVTAGRGGEVKSGHAVLDGLFG